MIVEIHESRPTMAGTLRYNEEKVLQGKASVLHLSNIPGNTLEDINSTFEKRERSTVRDIEHLSFHMSVNPGPGDNINEEDIPSFVSDMMDELGYSGQPWVIFRHNDIERVHYHVVSIRADENGRKIRDYYEKKRCDKIVLSLESKYGYTKGDSVSEKNVQDKHPVFVPGSDNIIKGIEQCIRHSLSYRFTTERQFAEILKFHGVRVQEGMDRKNLNIHLSFQGLDSYGKPCTVSVSDSRLGIDVSAEIQKRIDETRAMDLKEERIRIRNMLAKGLAEGKSFGHLVENLHDEHIDVVIYRDRHGMPRGMTFVDHQSRCAFRASDISRQLGTEVLSKAAGAGPGDQERTSVMENADYAADMNMGITDTLKSFLSCLIPEMQSGGQQFTEKKKKNKNKRKKTH